MELFNETKNNYFLKLIKLINMIISSDDYIYDEYRKKHHAVPETVKSDVFKNEMKQDLYWYLVLQDYIADSSKLNEEENRLIMTNADKMMYSYYEEPISILPCTAELTWLKTALEDERACSFFTPEELKELKQNVNLLNSDNTFDKYIVIRHEDLFGDKTDNYDPSDQKFDSLSYSSKLHRIRECLRKSWNIKYSYSNGKGIKGRKENQLAEPYKFEYSVTKDELKICAESISDKRPIKQVINNL
jgi:hypothetical protein